jgi:hypothetical protein
VVSAFDANGFSKMQLEPRELTRRTPRYSVEFQAFFWIEIQRLRRNFLMH